jgi:hypothetical protein
VQQYVNVQERAKGAAHNANLRIISSAANMYVMLEGEAPEGINDLQAKGYLQEVPDNPFGENTDPSRPWVGSYGVTVSGPDSDGKYEITVEPEPYEP